MKTRNGMRRVFLTTILAISPAIFSCPSVHAFCVSGACFDDYHPSSSSSYSRHRDDDIPVYTGPSPQELERRRKEEEERKRQEEERRRQQAAERANKEGIEFAKVGNWGEAIASFEKGLQNDPGNGSITHNLNLARDLKAKEKEAGDLIRNQKLNELEDDARKLFDAPDVPRRRPEATDTEANPKGVAAERKRLLAREAALDRAIKQDVKAINGLGFKRRAADFEEWDRLAEDAQEKLRQEAKAQVLDILTSLVQEKMVDDFRDMDRKRVERLIKWLKQNSEVPIEETVNVLRQIAKNPKRIRMAGQAKAIVDGISLGVEGAGAESREDKAKFLMDLLCTVGEGAGKIEACHLFKSEVLVTEAAVYNNVARRVAVHEVERLTRMTERQLKALKSIDKVMAKHVAERNRVRARLKELRASTDSDL